MDPAHLHLMINHLPIMGSALAIPLVGLALWRRGDKGATIAAATVLGLSAAGAVVALESGDGAEERVEDLPGVSERQISEHEERAETATVLAVVTGLGAIGAAAWAMKRGELHVGAGAGVLAGTVLTAGAMAWTGLAGGQISHEELRPGASVAYAGEAGEAGETREDEAREREEGERGGFFGGESREREEQEAQERQEARERGEASERDEAREREEREEREENEGR